MAEASLRQAAAALGLPLTSLRRLVEAEPTLRACVRPAGPRRAAAVDLPAMVAAWQRLQAATPQQTGLSPRQQLAIERRRRLHWQGEVLRLEVLAEEAQLMDAAEVAAVERQCVDLLGQALAAWLDEVCPQLPGMSAGDADALLTATATATLQRLTAQLGSDTNTPEPAPPAPAPVPDPLPDEDTLRALVERYRGDLHKLRARQTTGELVSAAATLARIEADAMRRRSQFLSLIARYGPAARLWRTESQARTQLGREVSAILAPG
ncbi:MAG: hypothetical protein VKM92_08255 [Cyanobacteriota bacterium]|nr:hypothetical protein [Cyanobacteriota bacterium]